MATGSALGTSWRASVGPSNAPSVHRFKIGPPIFEKLKLGPPNFQPGPFSGSRNAFLRVFAPLPRKTITFASSASSWMQLPELLVDPFWVPLPSRKVPFRKRGPSWKVPVVLPKPFAAFLNSQRSAACTKKSAPQANSSPISDLSENSSLWE